MALYLNSLMPHLSKWLALVVLIMVATALPAFAQQPRSVLELEGARTSSTGVAECDRYFSQLEICMKALLPPEDHEALEDGLELAKRAVISARGNPGRAQECLTGIEEAKKQYAGNGCVFN